MTPTFHPRDVEHWLTPFLQPAWSRARPACRRLTAWAKAAEELHAEWCAGGHSVWFEPLVRLHHAWSVTDTAFIADAAALGPRFVPGAHWLALLRGLPPPTVAHPPRIDWLVRWARGGETPLDAPLARIQRLLAERPAVAVPMRPYPDAASRSALAAQTETVRRIYRSAGLDAALTALRGTAVHVASMDHPTWRAHLRRSRAASGPPVLDCR